MAGKQARDGEALTNTERGIRRAAEMAAVFMIGDGLLGALQPTRHVDLWRSDVTAVDLLVRPFGGHPARRRAYGVLQAAAGLWLASRLRASSPFRAEPVEAPFSASDATQKNEPSTSSGRTDGG